MLVGNGIITWVILTIRRIVNDNHEHWDHRIDSLKDHPERSTKVMSQSSQDSRVYTIIT